MNSFETDEASPLLGANVHRFEVETTGAGEDGSRSRLTKRSKGFQGPAPAASRPGRLFSPSVCFGLIAAFFLMGIWLLTVHVRARHSRATRPFRRWRLPHVADY